MPERAFRESSGEVSTSMGEFSSFSSKDSNHHHELYSLVFQLVARCEWLLTILTKTLPLYGSESFVGFWKEGFRGLVYKWGIGWLSV